MRNRNRDGSTEPATPRRSVSEVSEVSDFLSQSTAPHACVGFLDLGPKNHWWKAVDGDGKSLTSLTSLTRLTSRTSLGPPRAGRSMTAPPSCRALAGGRRFSTDRLWHHCCATGHSHKLRSGEVSCGCSYDLKETLQILTTHWRLSRLASSRPDCRLGQARQQVRRLPVRGRRQLCPTTR
jgi:hypothetical protein